MENTKWRWLYNTTTNWSCLVTELSLSIAIFLLKTTSLSKCKLPNHHIDVLFVDFQLGFSKVPCRVLAWQIQIRLAKTFQRIWGQLSALQMSSYSSLPISDHATQTTRRHHRISNFDLHLLSHRSMITCPIIISVIDTRSSISHNHNPSFIWVPFNYLFIFIPGIVWK